MIALLVLQAAVTCTTVIGVTRCETPPVPLDYGAALRRGYNSVPTYQQMEAQNAANREANARQNDRALRARVGDLVAKGRCDDARTMALRGGDFDLAERVKAACE